MNTLLISDAYKQSHRVQYPEGTTLVYSNWTPRSDKHAMTEKGVVVFGIQAFLLKLNKWFNEDFFGRDLHDVEEEFLDEYNNFFGEYPDTSHLEDLHGLGYLPISVKALPEGSICPIGVPMLTIVNTKPEFFWITNFLETIMSTELWQPMTSATIAKEYKDIAMEWSDKTCDDNNHIPFQCHDFSMRGMAGLESAMASGAGHLTSFVGTDTIPAVAYVDKYYNGDNGLVGTSIPATEHSVMSMGTMEDEIGTFKRLITETYPNGLISIVSDTWDLWKVCTEYLPALKKEITARDGKVIIRPDSGDPVDIICGTHPWKSDINTLPRNKGVIELLWDTFGGTVNEKGYKVLDSRIGAIYGDSITLERFTQMCNRLEGKGFASSNIVVGVGSYTYQYNTRDTYSFAMKATYGEVDGIGRAIYKDPITDDGTKKSLKGLLQVGLFNSKYTVKDECTWEEEKDSFLELVYLNGKFVKTWTFKQIRDNLNNS